jgi:hypothetical protein
MCSAEARAQARRPPGRRATSVSARRHASGQVRRPRQGDRDHVAHSEEMGGNRAGATGVAHCKYSVDQQMSHFIHAGPRATGRSFRRQVPAAAPRSTGDWRFRHGPSGEKHRA